MTVVTDLEVRVLQVAIGIEVSVAVSGQDNMPE